MKNLISWIWILQCVSLLLVGVFWLLAPYPALHQIVEGLNSPVPATATRLLAPLIIAMGFFTALGILSSERMLRRHFAAIFALFLLPWMGVVAHNMLSRRGVLPPPTVSSLSFYGTGGFFLIIAVYSFFSYSQPDGSTTGYRTTAPSTLWPLWTAQVVVMLVSAVGLLLAPEWITRHLLVQPALTLPPGDRALVLVTVGQVRLFTPYLIGVALFTVYGLGRTGWFEIWTSMARIFSLMFGLLSLAALVSYQPDTFRREMLAFAAVAAWFAYQNARLLKQAQQDSMHDMGRPPEGWTLIDLAAGPMMALQMLLTKRRASHLLGVGARGEFVADPDPRMPPNEFFASGNRYPLQMRFANLTMRDDAALDVRGASMKLSLEPLESPFDMVFNTGSFCPARDIVEFAQLVASKFFPAAIAAAALRGNRRAREGGIAGLRRAPPSFLSLHYHSQIVRGWTDDQRRTYLVRYRLVTAGPEQGLPDAEDCAHIWERGRRMGEPRPPTYLRQELVTRLSSRKVSDGEEAPVDLWLEAQFCPFAESRDEAWYNAGVEWDERNHPWLKVGTLSLREAMPDRATELLRFNPWNQPESLFTPRAVNGFRDYRSLGDSEARVMHRLQRLRLSLYRVLGLPSFDRGSSR